MKTPTSYFILLLTMTWAGLANATGGYAYAEGAQLLDPMDRGGMCDTICNDCTKQHDISVCSIYCSSYQNQRCRHTFACMEKALNCSLFSDLEYIIGHCSSVHEQECRVAMELSSQ